MLMKAMNHGLFTALVGALWLVVISPDSQAQDDPKDWPTYNRDVIGTRHNPGETALDKANVGRLEEKWRFPPKDSNLEIGVIHATPIVVDGCVYFGTATDPAFYKLAPDGTLRWSYRNPAHGGKQKRSLAKLGQDTIRARFLAVFNGVCSSALVTRDTVFFDDTGGWIYALDRATGAERWKIDTRSKGFPGAHEFNTFYASPILADGKLVVAGGTVEQGAAAFPGYKGCTGRGFVAAFDPHTGKLLWKYDVGPKPEPLDPPIVITDGWGKHKFYFGPSTSSIWSTPSFDEETGTIFFGTDTNNSPRKPTAADPRLYTRESDAVIALSVRDGSEKWVTQIGANDVWINGMRAYDPKEGRYKDQSIGDTPKIYTIAIAGTPTKVVGVGCKNGGFYVLRAADGDLVTHTPLYTGPPEYPLSPAPDPRMLALPSAMGGLQTGCATDGKWIYTNGIDTIRFGATKSPFSAATPPTGGRVVALSLDTTTEKWRHERPKLASIGGPKPKAMYKDVGDPVASGIALANGVAFFTTVASGKLVALEAETGKVLKEIELGPVWSGPSVSRGRVYVGTGNTLISPFDHETFFPKKYNGVLYSFGLPGGDEVGRLGKKE
jgi:polyvinyl alcohol dehydrogenase (cytochrome)